MINVGTADEGVARLRELALEDAANEREAEQAEQQARRANMDFVQVYPKGWKRLQRLIHDYPAGARVFAFLAEHITGSENAVVASQEFLAEQLGLHERTIRRITQRLEKEGALVRIRVAGSVYAYGLDPEEIFKSWNDKKQYAAFVTKTLVKKSDRMNGQVNRALKVMMKEGD